MKLKKILSFILCFILSLSCFSFIIPTMSFASELDDDWNMSLLIKDNDTVCSDNVLTWVPETQGVSKVVKFQVTVSKKAESSKVYNPGDIVVKLPSLMKNCSQLFAETTTLYSTQYGMSSSYNALPYSISSTNFSAKEQSGNFIFTNTNTISSEATFEESFEVSISFPGKYFIFNNKSVTIHATMNDDITSNNVTLQMKSNAHNTFMLNNSNLSKHTRYDGANEYIYVKYDVFFKNNPAVDRVIQPALVNEIDTEITGLTSDVIVYDTNGDIITPVSGRYHSKSINSNSQHTFIMAFPMSRKNSTYNLTFKFYSYHLKTIGQNGSGYWDRHTTVSPFVTENQLEDNISYICSDSKTLKVSDYYTEYTGASYSIKNNQSTNSIDKVWTVDTFKIKNYGEDVNVFNQVTARANLTDKSVRSGVDVLIAPTSSGNDRILGDSEYNIKSVEMYARINNFNGTSTYYSPETITRKLYVRHANSNNFVFFSDITGGQVVTFTDNDIVGYYFEGSGYTNGIDRAYIDNAVINVHTNNILTDSGTLTIGSFLEVMKNGSLENTVSESNYSQSARNVGVPARDRTIHGHLVQRDFLEYNLVYESYSVALTQDINNQVMNLKDGVYNAVATFNFKIEGNPHSFSKARFVFSTPETPINSGDVSIIEIDDVTISAQTPLSRLSGTQMTQSEATAYIKAHSTITNLGDFCQIVVDTSDDPITGFDNNFLKFAVKIKMKETDLNQYETLHGSLQNPFTVNGVANLLSPYNVNSSTEGEFNYVKTLDAANKEISFLRADSSFQGLISSVKGNDEDTETITGSLKDVYDAAISAGYDVDTYKSTNTGLTPVALSYDGNHNVTNFDNVDTIIYTVTSGADAGKVCTYTKIDNNSLLKSTGNEYVDSETITVDTNNTYTYRLRAFIGHNNDITNFELVDNLEAFGGGSDWFGVLDGIDYSAIEDTYNVIVKAFGNTDRNATSIGDSGWVEITPESDLSQFKSIGFRIVDKTNPGTYAVIPSSSVLDFFIHMKSPQNYTEGETLNNFKTTWNAVSADNGQVIPEISGLVSNHNTVKLKKLATVTIKKINPDNEPLINADFALLDSLGQEAFTGTTDSTGTLVFSNVPIGTYTLHEVNPPEGYEAAEDVNVTVSSNEQDLEFTVTDEPIVIQEAILPETGSLSFIYLSIVSFVLLLFVFKIKYKKDELVKE